MLLLQAAAAMATSRHSAREPSVYSLCDGDDEDDDVQGLSVVCLSHTHAHSH